MTVPTAAEVWSVDLDGGAALLSHYLAELSPQEREHAEWLRAPDALACFAITRGVLRRLLGRRLGVEAHTLRIALGAGGKPFLAQHPELAFSVSHTRGHAVVALAEGGPIGVDVKHRSSLVAPAAGPLLDGHRARAVER